MRAVLKHEAAPGLSVRDDYPDPVAGPGEAVVEIAAASLCGTDRELYEWTSSAQAFEPALPVVLGHEAAGTVVAIGDGVTSVAIGDRVALESHLTCGRCFPCRTGNAHICERTRLIGMHVDGVFAERVAVPEAICVPLPDGLPFEQGALLEAAGVGMHAVQRSGLAVAGQRVLVNGGGPVGQVITRISRALGAAQVVVVEPNPFRRQIAEQAGADAVSPDADIVGLCRESSGRRGGFDAAFEVSAVAGVLPTIMESLRGEATVVTVGHPGAPVPIDVAAQINKKGITLRGIFGRRLWDTWEQLTLLLGSGRIDLASLVTHQLALEDADKAIELLTGDACKVLLVPGH